MQPVHNPGVRAIGAECRPQSVAEKILRLLSAREVLLTLAVLFTSLSASAQGTASVTLGWAMTDPNATDYQVYWGTASGAYTNGVDAGDDSSITITNLVGGVTYYFVADDFDANGDESPLSDEIAYTVPTQTPPFVALTSPGTGAHFMTPALFNLSASVVANGHSISGVNFYNGSSLVGKASSPPYSFTLLTMKPGNGSFTAVVVYDGNLSVTSSPVNVSISSPLSIITPITTTANFVTAAFPGTERNNFSGFIGMKIVVGAAPITVNALGRFMVAGNSGTHTLKLVSASDGSDVPGGTISIAMSGGAAGQFQYAAFSNPVTLAAGNSYYLLSQEFVGGDFWCDADTLITTASVATQTSGIWGYAQGLWFPYGAPGQCYGPLDFKYAVASTNSVTTTNLTVVSTNTYVTNISVGTLRNDFSGFVGAEIIVGSAPVSITALGRFTAPGNFAFHTLKLVNAASDSDVSGSAVSINMSGATVGQFQYTNLNNPITLAAGNTYYLLSQESAGGDFWYDADTTVSNALVAAENGAVWGYGPGALYPYGAPGQMYVPVDFKYIATNTTVVTNTPPAPPAPASFVTSTNLGTARDNFSGFVGMQFVVGSRPLNVTSLGRLTVAGNTESHTVKFVNASTGADVPGGAISIAMSGGNPGQFQYATLPGPITLAAGSSYYLVSQEFVNEDFWYDSNTTITTTTDATETTAIWSFGLGVWFPFGNPGQTYVPVDFKYTTQ